SASPCAVSRPMQGRSPSPARRIPFRWSADDGGPQRAGEGVLEEQIIAGGDVHLLAVDAVLRFLEEGPTPVLGVDQQVSGYLAARVAAGLLDPVRLRITRRGDLHGEQ